MTPRKCKRRGFGPSPETSMNQVQLVVGIVLLLGNIFFTFVNFADGNWPLTFISALGAFCAGLIIDNSFGK